MSHNVTVLVAQQQHWVLALLPRTLLLSDCLLADGSAQ
jgi:hypothetical protein